jgi:hypothetical protein
MPTITPGSNPVPLTPRLRLHPAADWQGTAQVPQSGPLVLGEEAPPIATTAPLSVFAPAEPAIELDVQSRPQPAVLGEEPPPGATLEYQPGDEAVYVLLQEVHTADGVIYDWTLPQRSAPQGGPLVLGDEAPPGGMLRFTVNPVAGGAAPAAPGSQPAVLGIEDIAIGAAVNVVTKRVLQVLRSPLDSALLAAIHQFEARPRALALRGDGFQPLDGAEAWRALLPPGGERRVLLYIHGFNSSTSGSGGGIFAPHLAANYDAVLGYDHPTAGISPLDNALELLRMIPDDLQLAVDLIAHSRGGLVVRSLVELVDWQPKFRPVHLLTAGSPHAGTRLAEPERWDRLVSIGMTLGSWLATVGGGQFWAPKLLELILKAAAQSIFDLPGIGAMTPGSDFLKQLNAADAPGVDDRVRYAAVTSTFAISDVLQQGFRQAFTALAAQVFMGEPNDLVVHTASALEIDRPTRVFPPEQQFRASVDHGSYFQDAGVVEFIKRHLSSV